MAGSFTPEEKQRIAESVIRIRNKRLLSQTELAVLAKCRQQTVGEVERAGSFSLRVLRDIAAALKVTEEELRFGVTEKSVSATTVMGNVHVERVTSAWREVPVVSWATAGAAKNYEDLGDYLDEMVVTECKDANAFAVIVDGDSMTPHINPGDRVVLSPNTEAQSGDIVIARTKETHEVYLKKFLRHGAHGKQVRLVSFNSDYPPLEFELSDFRFIYPVVNLVRVYKHINGG